MKRTSHGLLDEIERDALGSAPLADVLRKCLTLGGRAESHELKRWALKELRGYEPADDLPRYRMVGAPIQFDVMVGPGKFTGQRLGIHQLPDVAQDVIEERVPLRHGIGELESTIESIRRQGKSHIHYSLPGSAELAHIMDQESGEPFRRTMAIYWAVSESALSAVVDQVRTSLTELVVEMRAGMAPGDEVPSAAVADQAINVAVFGGTPTMTFNTAQASRQSDATVQVTGAESEPKASFWTRTRKIIAGAAGLATVAGTVIALMQYLR